MVWLGPGKSEGLEVGTDHENVLQSPKQVIVITVF